MTGGNDGETFGRAFRRICVGLLACLDRAGSTKLSTEMSGTSAPGVERRYRVNFCIRRMQQLLKWVAQAISDSAGQKLKTFDESACDAGTRTEPHRLQRVNLCPAGRNPGWRVNPYNGSTVCLMIDYHEDFLPRS